MCVCFFQYFHNKNSRIRFCSPNLIKLTTGQTEGIISILPRLISSPRFASFQKVQPFLSLNHPSFLPGARGLEVLQVVTRTRSDRVPSSVNLYKTTRKTKGGESIRQYNHIHRFQRNTSIKFVHKLLSVRRKHMFSPPGFLEMF